MKRSDRVLALGTVIIAAAWISACGTVYQAPSGPYMHLQTLLTTINVNTGSENVVNVSAYISGSSRRTDQSYGTIGAFPPEQSDSQGNLYVADPVFNAFWSFVWEDNATGSQCYKHVALSGDEPPYSDETYVQEGVSYFVNCVQYLSIADAKNYSVLKDGTEVYTGGADKLMPNEYLYPDDSRTSADGRFRIQYQGDGNLVLLDTTTSPWTPLWASNTSGTTAGFTVMGTDGNLVVYNADGNPVWASNTAGYDGAFVIVQSDGNFVMYYSGDGGASWYIPWATGTYGH